MRFFSCSLAVLALLAAGCGKSDDLLRTPGSLLMNGESFVPDDGDLVQITFVPIPADGTPALDYYFAEVDQETGSFWPAGKDRQGMPPGRYRVAVELMRKKKDVFEGRFDTEQSPFIFDVDAATDEIVIELDHPPTS